MQIVTDDYIPQDHVVRAYKNSECRMPIVLVEEDGDPFMSVCRLAKDVGSAVWKIEMGNSKNEQNAIDYIDVGVSNGDWVYLTNNEEASSDVLREIAKLLVTLKPDPKRFPRRELFRVFFTVKSPIDINANQNLPFPRLLLQNAIMARKLPTTSHSPTKWSKKLPEETHLLEHEAVKRVHRRENGRDSDSESDTEDPEHKVTGLWFHRAVDFYSKDEGAVIKDPKAEIFDAVEAENEQRIKEICQTGQVDIQKVRRDGMTPLLYAVSREKVKSVKALLELGADPNQVRESDSCPPLFMALEDEGLLLLLVEYGADINTKFEGERLEYHPATAPHIAILMRKIRLGEVDQ